MLTFVRRLLGLEHASLKKLMATEDALDALTARVDKHFAELKELRGRVNAAKRYDKPVQAAEDAPGPTIGPDEEMRRPAPLPTAHLANRFRIGRG